MPENLRGDFFWLTLYMWPPYGMSQWLLPATAARTARQIHVIRYCEGVGPGVHFMSPGLLQLTYPMVWWVMTRLQSAVQNAAARPVSGAWRHDHITPVLHQLHWLSVRKRVDFKTTTLVYRSFAVRHGSWPLTVSWSVSDEGRRQLRSADSRTCVVSGPIATLETDISRLPAQRYWTAFQLVLRQTNIG